MRTACAGVALTPSTGWGVGRWQGLPTGDLRETMERVGDGRAWVV